MEPQTLVAMLEVFQQMPMLLAMLLILPMMGPPKVAMRQETQPQPQPQPMVRVVVQMVVVVMAAALVLAMVAAGSRE
jgi:hypothetical protein